MLNIIKGESISLAKFYNLVKIYTFRVRFFLIELNATNFVLVAITKMIVQLCSGIDIVKVHILNFFLRTN